MPSESDDLTIGPTAAVTTPSAHPPASSRFAPGSIIAGRYRLVALLGRGGMGDVYRADDMTLDHPVALKFLPGEIRLKPDTTAANRPGVDRSADHDARLAQFHNELRIARQVSHKNVCRLNDLARPRGAAS